MTKTQLTHKTFRAAWFRVGLGVLLVALALGAQTQTHAATAQPAESAYDPNTVKPAERAPDWGTVPLAPEAAGALDPTFGPGGKVTTDFPGGTNHRGYAVGLQSDGQIVVAGSADITATSEVDVALARYNKSNGLLDTTFGTGGERLDGKGDFTTSKAFGVAIQTDDKIVVAGITDWDGHDSFMLRRYLNTDGAPDTSIDGSGDTITDFTMGSFTAASGNAVAIQPDGNIVIAGSVQNSSEFHDFALARYISTDGTLDISFTGGGPFDGTVVTQIQSQTDDSAHAVAIQPADSKIVVVGESNGTFAMARYNPDGSLDTTGFGANGIVLAASVGPGYAVAIQTDGKIVVAGTQSVTDLTTPNCIGSLGHICFQFEFYVARYNTDGSLDTTGFGTGGETTTLMNSQGNNDQAYAVAIQPDGKIVVAGYTDNGINDYPGTDPWINYHHDNDFALARYNTDGLLDTTFGTGGKVTTDFFGSLDDEGRAVAIQTDGKIVVAGYNDAHNFALARYDGGASYFVYLPFIDK